MTRPFAIKLDDIKARANAKRLEIMDALDIKERPNDSGLLLISDPKAKDIHPSFAIWTGKGILTWKRFGTGYSGDIIDFVAYMRGWYDLPKKGRSLAIRWLIDYLRLETVDPEQLKRDAAQSKRRIQLETKKAEEELERDRRGAFKMFKEARADIRGTPVATYLWEARGIDLDALARGPRGGDLTPSVLRYVERSKHISDTRPPVETWWPVMLAACTDTLTSRITAVHRTWLAHDGRGKAGVEPDRKTWPSAKGMVIPLWRGESGLSVRAAIECGLRETFTFCEGIEDGLTAVLAKPQYRTWCFIFLDNLPFIALPECCDGVILHRQNEWHNRNAVSAFDRGKAKLEAQGRPVAEVHAMIGKDLNDTQRGAA